MVCRGVCEILATHYVCGWRADDICNNWPVPDDEFLIRGGIDLRKIMNMIQMEVSEREF